MKTILTTYIDIELAEKIKNSNLKPSDLLVLGARYKFGELIANEGYESNDSKIAELEKEIEEWLSTITEKNKLITQYKQIFVKHNIDYEKELLEVIDETR